MSRPAISNRQWSDAQAVWDYHLVHHTPRPCSVAIALGSHDLGVATHAATLFHSGYFPTLIFTGGNSPTTIQRFPRGEAVHYREHALSLGVPEAAIIVEPKARNTQQNIEFSHNALSGAGVDATSVMLISKPYEERRSFATFRRFWPEAGIDVVCSSEPVSFTDYARGIGDSHLVIDMLVGTLQRVIEYPQLGFTVEQPVPGPVMEAYERLREAGFTSRLLRPLPT
ncbi:YdcF family protein [Streptomyces sp. NBC_00690]|uniref:YdcF family protein n=1 Tax=Streptomyces sp. NBC_00690 TaxID=2975808 RepID=UPI002E2BC9AE|nr:YdcF family protein [Streptomyces sp. NBC_00690]